MIVRRYLGYVLVAIGLFLSLQLQARVDRFYVYNAANGLADNSAQTILCTLSGRLVITTIGQINFYDGNRFTYIDPSTENIYPLSKYRGNYHIYFDRSRHLWLKDTHSVTCVDLITERFVDSVEDVFREFGCDTDVSDLFVDCTNVVWLLTEKGLFNVETKQNWPVRSDMNLQDLEVWEEKYLLLFYENGLLEMTDMEMGKRVYWGKAYGKDDEAHYGSSSVTHIVDKTLFQIRNGHNQGILMSFDLENHEWKTLIKTPYYLSNLAEHDSVLYIPSAYGYWTYDLSTEKVNHVQELTMASGGKLLTDINAMVFDQQGGMWVGTEKRGLLYSRPVAAPFKVYNWENLRALELATMMESLPEPQTRYRDKAVNCVLRDSRGWDWVGTSSGLQLYRSSSDRLPVVYTRNDGLLNNVIHTIIEDGMHNIWVGTSSGISCLLIQDGNLRFINSYNQWDNVPSESFVNGKALRLNDGTITMQMLDHVIEFNPDKMITVTGGVMYDITPKLIRLMVNGNNLQTGDELDSNVILDKAIPRMKEINLNYNQNSVTLTFSSMNYFRPEQTFYRVRIKGLDETWRVLARYNSGGLVDSRGLLHLPMVALKPGSYVVEVQASMVPDRWDMEPYQWVINVNEPWWRTTGVLLLFVLLLLILLGINTYYYIKNVGMRANRNAQERGVVRQIRRFAEHCSRQDSVVLEPVPEEYKGMETSSQNVLTPEFISTMEKLLPIVLEKDDEKLTMRELCAEAKMELPSFYQLILGNIYKSPRPMAKTLMLRKAEHLLTTTEKEVEEIASECGFISPNYFIGTFYHEHQMTPEVYRQKNSRLRQAFRFS
jgi:ligand-binding sensor domain-containing protein/AraC-like DNA-binding protein